MKLSFHTFTVPPFQGKGLKVRYLTTQIAHGQVVDTLMTITPERSPGNSWMIIPTLEVHPILSMIKGPSFAVILRWLRWEMTLLQWTRDPVVEEETADPHQ